jgi:hypothetical protein
MLRLTTTISMLMAAILCGSLFAANTQPTIQSFNKMPVAFTKNMGQWDDRVLFRANAGGATMWFTKEGVTYQFTRRITSPPSPLPGGEEWSKTGEREMGHSRAGGDPSSVGRTFLSDPGQAGMPILPVGREDRDSVEQLVLTAKFVGANPNPEFIAEGQIEYKCNYFIGNEPSKWYTDVPNYEAITLKDIYPGVDLKYSGRRGTGQAAYEFIAAPGADIAQIKVAYEGAEATSIDADGRLILQTKWGDMTAAIETPEDGALSGNATFSQLSEKTIGFEAGSSSRQALGTLGVRLVYGTYLGGNHSDYGFSIAVDDSGCAYVTGRTQSSSFPLQNPLDSTNVNGSHDAFVAKFSAAGNNLIYSTYLGGGDRESGFGIAVDGSGRAYVTGWTASSDFPTWNPYQTHQGPVGYPDAFVTKLSTAGNSLVYSTHLGGAQSMDYGTSIAIDSFGCAYVTGYTQSTDFPMVNPYDNSLGVQDAFVTKLSAAGNSLAYSTFLGGADMDVGAAIAIDGSGCAYVTGTTKSLDFPLENPYDGNLAGLWDSFVTKLSAAGNSLAYSTYLGGNNEGDLDEESHSIAVDDSGHAFVAGRTSSSGFPTQNPYDGSYGGRIDAYITKLSTDGNSLIYSTYLGGGSEDIIHGIAIDSLGCAYLVGSTVSLDFPMANAYDNSLGEKDAFVSKLSADGSSLVYSTYLGGRTEEEPWGIAVDKFGCAYVTGETSSDDFPVLNPFSGSLYGYNDAFVAKLGALAESHCGDVNGDNFADISDVVYLIAYIFSGGSAPSPLIAGDANCDSMVDISDVVYLIAYIFSGGLAPCAGC